MRSPPASSVATCSASASPAPVASAIQAGSWPIRSTRKDHSSAYAIERPRLVSGQPMAGSLSPKWRAWPASCRNAAESELPPAGRTRRCTSRPAPGTQTVARGFWAGRAARSIWRTVVEDSLPPARVRLGGELRLGRIERHPRVADRGRGGRVEGGQAVVLRGGAPADDPLHEGGPNAPALLVGGLADGVQGLVRVQPR